MNNMYAMVLFLVVITSTSSVLCASSGTDQEIFMVVDDQSSSMLPRMKINKTENPVQIGQFLLKDGKVLTLSRPANDRQNCVGIYESCNPFSWCCEGLQCSDIVGGECLNNAYCREAHTECKWLYPCCYPSTCNSDTDTCEY